MQAGGGHHAQKGCGLAHSAPAHLPLPLISSLRLATPADLRSGQSECKGLKAVAGLRYFPSPAGEQD